MSLKLNSEPLFSLHSISSSRLPHKTEREPQESINKSTILNLIKQNRTRREISGLPSSSRRGRYQGVSLFHECLLMWFIKHYFTILIIYDDNYFTYVAGNVGNWSFCKMTREFVNYTLTTTQNWRKTHIKIREKPLSMTRNLPLIFQFKWFHFNFQSIFLARLKILPSKEPTFHRKCPSLSKVFLSLC